MWKLSLGQEQIFCGFWAEFQSGAKQCLMHRTIVVSDSGKRQIGQLDQNYAAWVEMFDTLTDQKNRANGSGHCQDAGEATDFRSVTHL